MRFAAYGLTSTFLSIAFIFHAFYIRDFHFFAASVHLTRSPISTFVLLNWGLYEAIVFVKITQSFFFGELRVIEVEVSFIR